MASAGMTVAGKLEIVRSVGSAVTDKLAKDSSREMTNMA